MRAWVAGACAAAALLAAGGAAEGRRAAAVRHRLAPPPRSDPPFVQAMARRLEAAGIGAAPGAALIAVVGAPVLVVGAAVVAGGPALAGVAALGLAGAGEVGRRWWRSRAELRARRALPDVVEGVARALETGLTIPQALAEAASRAHPVVAPGLHRLVAAIDAGAPVEQALTRWAGHRAHRGARLAAAALAVGARTGGAHARALHGVAATLRDELALDAEVRALAAQARMSALVISVAPLGFVAFTTATDARVAHFLLRTPPGWLVLGVGLLLDAVAATWMARLSRVQI